MIQSEKVHVWLSGMTPVAKPPHIPSVVERWLLRRPSSPERTVVRGRGARALPRPLLCAGKKARGWGESSRHSAPPHMLSDPPGHPVP